MDLPVLGDDRAGHVAAADPELATGTLSPTRFELSPTRMIFTQLSPSAIWMVALGRAEQPRGGLGDLPQRLFGIIR